MNRRSFLFSAALASGGAVLTFGGFARRAEAIAEALRRVFEERRFADKVVESILKSNPRWGSRDRRLIAETTYDIVRWWRLIRETAGLPMFEGHFGDTLSAWLMLNRQPVPHHLPNPPFSEDELHERLKQMDEIPRCVNRYRIGSPIYCTLKSATFGLTSSMQ